MTPAVSILASGIGVMLVATTILMAERPRCSDVGVGFVLTGAFLTFAGVVLVMSDCLLAWLKS